MRLLARKPKTSPQANSMTASTERPTRGLPAASPVRFGHDFSRISIQPKLQVGAVGEPLEREADVLADRVTDMPDSSSVNPQKPEFMRTGSPAEPTLSAEAPHSVYQVLRSAGQPLDSVAREKFETRFGFDFGHIRIHTDAQANQSTQEVGAKAYTVGEHLAFAEGQYQPGTVAGQRLLAHELVHVVQQESAVELPGSVQQARPTLHTARLLSRQPASQPKLLNARQATAAAADVKTFDENSIRFIRFLANLPSGVSFSDADAEALAQEQKREGQPATGSITKAYLDFILPKFIGEAAQSTLIHLVIDRAKLNVSQVLAVRFDPSISTESDITFLPGGVAEVLIGSTAFTTYDKMLAAINKQLAKKPPAATTTAVPKAVLDKAADQTKAISANKAKFTDPRLIKIVQGAAGNKPTGSWDVDTVRHIAALQQLARFTADGAIDDKTLELLVTSLVHGNNQDAALYLIIGFYGLNRSHALSIRFDPAFQPPSNDPTAVAQTTGVGSGVGGVVRMGPGIFALPFVNIVHTLAHELGHVEQVIAGVSSLEEREFLSRVIEIQSQGIPELPIESAADIALIQGGGTPSSKGFLVLANQTLNYWRQLTTAQKRAHLVEFRAIRQIVINRTGTATQMTQAGKTTLANQWNAADAGL